MFQILLPKIHVLLLVCCKNEVRATANGSARTASAEERNLMIVVEYDE
jgi:hypothetical protein